MSGTLPETVLVTGAAGFIGSHLVERLLDEGCRVLALDNFDPYYSRDQKERNLRDSRRHVGFTFFEADICDDASLAEPFRQEIGAIVHLAARAGVRASIGSERAYVQTNVAGMLNVLERARVHGVPQLVFGASSSVYGDAEPPVREDAPADRPLQPYAATKRAGELLAYTYAHLHGLRVTCARLFSVYGPRQRPDLVLHKFARRIDAGETLPILGDGTAARDYTYISDIVDGLVAALRTPFAYEIINLGNGRAVPLRRVIALLESHLGRRAQCRYLPANPGDARTTCADITKARRLLGYEPRVPFEEGIRRFVAWYRSPERVSDERSDEA